MFLNNEDFISSCEKLLNEKKDKKIYFALSYDTDLPSLESIYPYCNDWVNFAATQKNLTIEIRTKSSNINDCFNTPILPNVIWAWSILPNEIINKYEPFTPSLQLRLKAISNALIQNRKVMLCIDPLILIPNYQSIYQKFLDNLSQQLELHKIYKFSIGTFRINDVYFKNIKKHYPNSGLYHYNYIKENNSITYYKTDREKLLNTITDFFKKENLTNYVIYE
jgi:spore photoproduct lyase